MAHPLVGRTFIWMYETGMPGAGFEVTFISDHQKTSKDVTGVAQGYAATHTYDLAVVAPNVYMISWLEDSGNTLTVVLNLNEMRIYSSYSTTAPERIFMTGTIREIKP